jgi:hypothetical protein
MSIKVTGLPSPVHEIYFGGVLLMKNKFNEKAAIEMCVLSTGNASK